ncbi:MAG: hypothetical protein ACXAEU_06305 [Candidatus Hodarchaeales archaeon]
MPIGIFKYAGDKDPVTVPKSTHTTVILDFHISVGSITLEVNSGADYLVHVTNEVSIREGSGAELADAEEVTHSEVNADKMNVVFDSNDVDILVDYEYDITIKVNNNITLQINFEASTGDLTTTISDTTIIISSLEMATSTGSISLTLGAVEFSESSPTLSTSTGGQTITLTNINYTTSTIWGITLSTGNANVDITDTNSPNNDTMTQKFNISGSTSKITVATDLHQDFGVKITATTSIGDITLPGGGESYTSSNYSSANQKYDFDLDTSTGDITFTET